jgi:hypothetical protein
VPYVLNSSCTEGRAALVRSIGDLTEGAGVLWPVGRQEMARSHDAYPDLPLLKLWRLHDPLAYVCMHTILYLLYVEPAHPHICHCVAFL